MCMLTSWLQCNILLWSSTYTTVRYSFDDRLKLFWRPTNIFWPSNKWPLKRSIYFLVYVWSRPNCLIVFFFAISAPVQDSRETLQNGLKKGILCKINFRTVAQFVFYMYSFNKSEYKLLKNFPVDFLESLTSCAAAALWVDLLVNDALIEPCSPCIIYMVKIGYIRLFIKDEKVGQHREGIIYEVIFPFYKQFMFHSCTSY